MQRNSNLSHISVDQFVVWGAGKLGRALIDLLGSERIIAFIESDVKRIGTTYDGIPIIDYKTYKTKLMWYPIIVSAKYAEQEILLFLQQDGVEWAFPFSINWIPMEGFLRQAPVEDILKKYNKNEILYVYGYTPLGLLMYSYLIREGYQCKLLFQSSVNKLLSQQIMAKKWNIRAEKLCKLPNNAHVLLATEVNVHDKLQLNQVNLESWYDLGEQELYYNQKIEQFKNIHKGERCFIVATGPSLTVEDLNILYKEQEICFSVNGIFRIFENTKWRPQYYILDDTNGMREWKGEILKMDVENKFIADVAWNLQNNEVTDNIFKWHFQRRWIDGHKPDFSEDFSRKSFCGMTIIYDGALQLAAYMGFKEIYLLGTDCCQYDDPKQQHFISDYSKEKSTLKIDCITLAYQSAKEYAETHGIRIYNATRGGKLEIFERIDFDSLFPESKTLL